MTAPSNAELREAIIVALSQPMSKRVSAVEAIFQAREQQLLTGLLGEAVEVEDAYGNMVAVVPVSVIERYREGL